MFKMDFIAGLALVLLALVGYSSGSVLGAKGRMAVPDLADLLVVIIIWIAALATRDALGKWSAIVTWLVIGLVLGTILAWVRADSYPQAQPLNTGSGLWNAWKGFAQNMGNYQSRVLMAFVYFTVVLPFGLGMTLLGDPLRIKRPRGNSNWQPKELPLKPSIDEARRQF
jgi:hypothetical protein